VAEKATNEQNSTVGQSLMNWIMQPELRNQFW